MPNEYEYTHEKINLHAETKHTIRHEACKQEGQSQPNTSSLNKVKRQLFGTATTAATKFVTHGKKV